MSRADACNVEEPEPSRFDLLDTLDLRLLHDRTVVLNSDIEEFLAGKLTRVFQLLAEKPEPVTLLISSHGGELDSGGTIIRAMQHAQECGCTITAEVRGYAMSMAFIILQHADIRFASRDDILMVHGPSGANIGDIRNQEADLKLTNHILKNWATFLAERNTSDDECYHQPEFWNSLFKDNLPHYLFGQEACKQGLIDAVI